MMTESDWLASAEKFIDDGDPRGVRACALEILESEPQSIEGKALLAESELYLGRLDDATVLIDDVLSREPKHLRARLVKGGIAAERFRLDIELPILRGVVDDARLNSDKNILFRALTWLSNGLYLAGEPDAAADCLLEASQLKDDRAAELYGKQLFYRNYRNEPSLEAAKKYQSFFGNIKPFESKILQSKKIRIGYISPDFRHHAVAYFVEPFFRYFDAARFEVFCYQTTKGDAVTRRLKKNKVHWRELIDKTPLEAARKIHDDALDILIDLSGHSQNSCLPIMAYKPAPIQITAIGYIATTGLEAIDFFLSDEFCLQPSKSTGEFGEKIIRLPDCHMCFAPNVVQKMPRGSEVPPVVRNGYITFGSFNNFAKVSDQVLALWREILTRVENSRLIIKAKTCSIESGRELVRRRLKDMSIDPSRVELREFSPNWLEQYSDIDIALDTFPYNGGLTTCEALYMGVPVISIAGRTHSDRIAASILHSARRDELIAPNSDEYIQKAAELAGSTERLKYYRSTLRKTLTDSPLMNARRYMSNLETIFVETKNQTGALHK